MRNKVYNGKTDKVTEKNVENHTNQNANNNNMACIYLKLVSFTLTINQVI